MDIIQRDQTNIKIDVTNVENEVANLSAEINALDVRISNIQGQETGARDQIKLLIARIVALEQSSQSAQASIISAQDIDINIQNQLDDIRVQVDFLSGLIGSSGDKATILISRLDQIDSD